MIDACFQLLKEIEDLGYVAYIVGGYPRDTYLKKKTLDIDITTSMKKEELEKHFNIVKDTNLASYIICYQDYLFEVTTFRKEGSYKDKRRPEKVTFVSSLEEDLKRRDFTINTLCMDKNGNYVDILGARKDIDKKIIKVVGNTNKKLKEDPLRILRAIRFASDLDFTLDKKIIDYIKKNPNFLDDISTYHQNKEKEKVKNKKTYEELLSNLTKS